MTKQHVGITAMKKSPQESSQESKEKDPEFIRQLQKNLNEFNRLKDIGNGTETTPLEVTGELDKATQKAWKTFKKETFADSSLNLGVLLDKEPKGMGFSMEKLKELGVNPDIYDREAPPRKLVEAVQKELKLEIPEKERGKMDTATRDAILSFKKEKWIDGKFNEGALKKLDNSIRSMQDALELQNEPPEQSQPSKPESEKAAEKGASSSASGRGSKSNAR
jgi:hypothetical protein